MKKRTIDSISILMACALLIVSIAISMDANATNRHGEANAKAQATSEAASKAASKAASESASESASNAVSYSEGSASHSSSQGGAATASNDGNEVNIGGDSVENNSSNVVLVPNNNTESCVRVFGFAFGSNGDAGALGIPWRSKTCDLEQAADDAFAGGERDLGWFWKCHNKSLYKPFMSKGESKESAIDDCHTRMLASTSTEDVIRALEKRLTAADNQIDLLRRHQTVCDESLERCESKVFEGK